MSRVVQVQILGRFGNQLFEYACARKYAEIHNASLEIIEIDAFRPRAIFHLPSCPPATTRLPLVCDVDAQPGEPAWGQVNIQLYGYFQFQAWVNLLSRAELKHWFQIDPVLLAACGARPYPRYTACHLRRGDYVGHALYATVLKQSYEACMAREKLIDPVVWVSDEAPHKFVGRPANGLDFLPDFVMLLRANTILRANSSFSWWAATLSNAEAIYSPVVEGNVGEIDASFVKGNYPKNAGHSNVTDLHLPE